MPAMPPPSRAASNPSRASTPRATPSSPSRRTSRWNRSSPSWRWSRPRAGATNNLHRARAKTSDVMSCVLRAGRGFHLTFHHLTFQKPMSMIKRYLENLLHQSSEHPFGQDAVEWAIVTGRLKLKYELAADLKQIHEPLDCGGMTPLSDGETGLAVAA